MKALHRSWLRACAPLTAVLAALFASFALAQSSAIFPPAAKAADRELLQVHSYFMIVITVVFVVVLGITMYTMFKHRNSASAQSAKFAGATGTVQWLWAMVPFAILLFIDYVLLGIHFNS